MPEIPRYSFDGRLASGPVGAELSVEGAMAPALSRARLGQQIAGLGQSLQQDVNQVSSAIQASNDRKKAFDEQRETEEAMRASSEASHSFEEWKIGWHQKNGNAENVAALWKADYEKHLAEIESTLPNQKAVDRFRNIAIPDAQNQWARNLQNGEKTRLVNITIEHERNASRGAEAIDQHWSLGNSQQAREQTMVNIDESIEFADVLLGDKAPETAANIKEKSVAGFITQATEHDPRFARELLSTYSDSISQQARNVLASRIDAAEKSVQTTGLYMRTLGRQHEIAIAGQNGTTVSEDFDYTGIPQFQADKMRMEAKAVNIASPYIQSFAGKNPQWQKQSIQALAKNAQTNPVEFEAYNLALAKAVDNEKAAKDSPHDYIIQGNEAVNRLAGQSQSAWLAASKATGPIHKQILESNAREIHRQALEMSDHYQGFPPKDAKNPEDYLNLAEGERSYVTTQEVKDFAPKIANGSPEEIDANVVAFFGRFPQKLQHAAWASFLEKSEKQGDKIPQGYDVALMVQSGASRRAIQGSIRESKSFGDINTDKGGKPVKESDLTAAVAKHPSVTQFTEVFKPRDGLAESAPFIVNVRSVIQKRAIALMVGGKDKGGMSMNDAVEQSAKEVIGDNFGFTEFNNQTLAVPVHTEDWATGRQSRPRSPEETKRVGDNLQMAVRKLPTEMLDSRYFAAIGKVNWDRRGTPEAEVAVQKALLGSAKWRPDPSGNSMVLFLHNGETGQWTQPYDKNGKPFVVTLDGMEEERAANQIRFELKGASYSAGPGAPAVQHPTVMSGRPQTPDDLPPIYKPPVGDYREPTWVERQFGRTKPFPDDPIWMQKLRASLGMSATPPGKAQSAVYSPPKLGREWVNQR